jgi:basic membrane protein A and related proteins
MRAAIVLSIAALLASCQAFVDTDTAAGIGAQCSKDRDCQGARCQDDLCVLDCGSQEDCPEGTQCLGALCQLPLRAAFIWSGDPGAEDWTRSHEIARATLQGRLSFLTEAKAFPNVATPAGAAAAIDQAIAEKFDVIFANSPSFATTMQEKAAANEAIDFFTAGGRVLAGNHSSYDGRMYKAWYLAGQAAATKSPGKQRLGMVASFVTPTVVQHVNAFTLGARRIAPDIVVEVRWIGFWHDIAPMPPEPKEAALTEALVDTGCDVIAHQADNGLVVQKVASLASGALSIGYNTADSCSAAPCIGAVYWNWTPLYLSILNDVHRGAGPENANVLADIEVNPADSVVNFDAQDDGIDVQLGGDLVGLAEEEGVGRVFTGPFCFDNAGDCVEAGVALSDDDLRSMCRFVEGVVEKEDPADPLSIDVDAIVPLQDDCAPAPM